MLTETVAGRTYDYTHNVGRGSQSGMGFNYPNSLTFAPDGTVYITNRGSESISNVGWNRTGVGQRITKVTIGDEWGEEEFVGEYSRYGDGDGQLAEKTYPDFVSIARGYGVEAAQVRNRDQFPEALATMLACDGPYLLDVVCPYQEHVLPMIPSGHTVRDIITE